MGRSAAISTVERSNLAAVAYLGSGCDIGFHQHDRLLEFVAGPQCPVIEVASWLALLNEFARVKNPVVGLKPQVTIRLPPPFRPRIVATGDVCFGAESWFQRNGRKSVTCLRCHSPCPDICGTEAAKLPKRFIIEI